MCVCKQIRIIHKWLKEWNLYSRIYGLIWILCSFKIIIEIVHGFFDNNDEECWNFEIGIPSSSQFFYTPLSHHRLHCRTFSKILPISYIYNITHSSFKYQSPMTESNILWIYESEFCLFINSSIQPSFYVCICQRLLCEWRWWWWWPINDIQL